MLTTYLCYKMPKENENKRKRVLLTIAQKLEICEKIKRKVSYEEIMHTYNIGKSTICDIKNSETKMREFASNKELLGIKNATKSAKSMKPSNYDEVDRALYIWFKQMREKNVPISGPILMEKVIFVGIRE